VFDFELCNNYDTVNAELMTFDWNQVLMNDTTERELCNERNKFKDIVHKI